MDPVRTVPFPRIVGATARSETAEQQIHSLVAGQLVVTLASEEDVVAMAALQVIATRAAIHENDVIAVQSLEPTPLHSITIRSP